MGRSKQKHQALIRFKVGTHGGCEASLFEFRERSLSEPHVVRIAAADFDDALAYLRWYEPGFLIDKVENQGIILLISGSPAD